MLLFSKTEADGFKQHLSFLNACMSDTVKKFTLDPQNNPRRDKTIRPVYRTLRHRVVNQLARVHILFYGPARIYPCTQLLCYFRSSGRRRSGRPASVA